MMAKIDYYGLFEFSPLPMWVVNIDTFSFLDVNIAAINHYGYTKAEFLSMSFCSIFAADRPLSETEALSEKPEAQEFFQNTARHLKKDGTLINVKLESNPIDFAGIEARIVLIQDITAQLKVEQSLKHNEERFRALVQDGSDLVVILDANLNYRYVSPASFSMLGILSTELIGRNVLEFVHKDDVPKVVAEAALLEINPQVQFSPFRFLDSDKNWRWIESKATNLIHDKVVGGIVCNSKDITEAIEGQKAMQESMEKYNIVSKATSDIVWDYNLETKQIFWNKGVKGILKHSLPDYTSSIEWWEAHLHPEDRHRVVQKLRQYIRSNKVSWDDEYRFACGDGTYKYIFSRGYIGFNELGAPSRMIGAMQDISRRKEEEHWSRLLESVVTNTTDGVMITDAIPGSGKNIIYVNEAMLKMTGYTKDELLGVHPDILVGIHRDQKGLEKLAASLENAQACNVELINYTKQGKRYEVSVNINPVTDTTGTITHWVSVQRDITENKKYINAVEEQNTKLKDIAWVQSHLVREPLTQIMAMVELLKEDLLGEDKEKLLNYISQSAKELDEVISSINRNACQSIIEKEIVK